MLEYYIHRHSVIDVYYSTHAPSACHELNLLRYTIPLSNARCLLPKIGYFAMPVLRPSLIRRKCRSSRVTAKISQRPQTSVLRLESHSGLSLDSYQLSSPRWLACPSDRALLGFPSNHLHHAELSRRSVLEEAVLVHLRNARCTSRVLAVVRGNDRRCGRVDLSQQLR